MPSSPPTLRAPIAPPHQHRVAGHLGDQGFNGIDIDQWNTLISTIIKSKGRERFKPNNPVIDFGCGAGAFLQTLRLLQGSLRLYGIDYSGPLVDVARHRVGNDEPFVGVETFAALVFFPMRSLTMQ